MKIKIIFFFSPKADFHRSSLLDEFRTNKNNRKFELRDIVNHVVEFSTDQHGSRFIQQKLETASVAGNSHFLPKFFFKI